MRRRSASHNKNGNPTSVESRDIGQDRSENLGKPATKNFEGKEKGLCNEFIYQVTSGNDASMRRPRKKSSVSPPTSTRVEGTSSSLSHGAAMDILVPVLADGETSQGVIMLWKMKAGMALARRQLLEANLTSAYALNSGTVQRDRNGESEGADGL